MAQFETLNLTTGLSIAFVGVVVGLDMQLDKGENFIPSTAVRRFDFHKPGGYLGNVRFVVHPQPVFTY